MNVITESNPGQQWKIAVEFRHKSWYDEEVYDLFTKYLKWIQEESLSDDNILCFQYLDFAKPEYDYVIIDEIQDLCEIRIAKLNFVVLLKLRLQVCENVSFFFDDHFLVPELFELDHQIVL